MHPPALDRLLAELAGEPGRVILTGRLDGVTVPDGVEVVDLDHAPPPTRSAAVVLVAGDVRDLRAIAFPRLGRTRTVVCVLRTADEALAFPWLPTWPAIDEQDAHQDGDGAVAVARFSARVPAHEVYAALAGTAGGSWAHGCRGLVIGFVRGEGQPVPPADATYVEITPDTRIADLVVPPDVVLSAEPLDLDESPVTGRVPAVIDARGEVFVDDGLVQGHVDPDGPPSSYAWRADLARRAGLELPPLPPTRIGAHVTRPRAQSLPAAPIGFEPVANRPVVDLSSLRPGAPDAATIAALRPVLGVRVDDPASVELLRGLAAAGVPLVVAGPSVGLHEALGDTVARAVQQPVDLTDPLAREEHSIVVRRAALDAFGGTDPSSTPVSILLATRRPEMLDHALAQVARQRGVDAELVLAPHGFEPDPARIRELLGDRPVRIVAGPADTLFGRVLADAAAAASGEVLVKMDDDDWYGPDVVADLLRARTYSGAPVVGSAADWIYLTDREVTVRQHVPSEKYTNFVAGGTLMIDVDLYRAVGGFRAVRKYVDAQLLEGVRGCSAAIYRTHGMGYLLRRNPVGHTWTLASDDLVKADATSVPGFAPSRLLEHPTP